MSRPVHELLRERSVQIIGAWEALVAAETPAGEPAAPALASHAPALLDALVACTSSDDGRGCAEAVDRSIRRLDDGVGLARTLRELRLLREAVVRELLRSGDARPSVDVEALVRLGAGFDAAVAGAAARAVAAQEERERARADAAVRASEARYRSLFEAMDEGFCIVEVIFDGERPVDYRFLEVNPAFEKHTGVGGAVGRRMREIAPDHEQHWFEAYGRVALTGEPTRFERPAKALGRFFDVFAFRVDAPEQRHVAIVFTDIAARRRTELALRESEEKLSLLANTMPQIVCVLASDGAPEYVNPSWTAFSGLDLEGTRRVGWASLVHPDDLPAVIECRRRVLKLLSPQEVEVRFRAADGAHRWFLCRVGPIVEEGGHVAQLVGAGMNIEDRRRREEALRHQLALQDQLAKVAASVPGVVCSFRLRPDGSVSMPLSAPAIADLYGLSRDDLARDMSPVFARIRVEDLERVKRTIAESARTMTPWHDEFRYEHPTKGLRWLEGASIPAREDDGSLLWHGYVADVSDRRRAEEALRDANERLRESDRRKDEFLGMLSHELRNPLAPIRNALYILDRTDPAGPQGRRARAVASRQVAHLTRLVDDLLDVTRIARGKIELRRADVDLVALAHRAAEDHREVMEERGLDLAVDLPASPVVVYGDDTRLAQVLGNLLGNAAKFTPRGGRVKLGVTEDGRDAIVHVHDTGTGIDPAMLRSIFEPFTQAHQSLARTEGGLGLGLALVKGLVTLHGGEVHAFSEGADRGTDFVVRLPLAEPRAPATRDERGRSGAAASPRRHVLVVDDNHDAAETLAELVQMLGHETEVAHDGAAALAAARVRPPDVVLCDIGLPGMDGYAIARELRARGLPGLRLVAISGYAQPEDVARALEAGFDEHVAKPPDPDRIAAVIR